MFQGRRESQSCFPEDAAWLLVGPGGHQDWAISDPIELGGSGDWGFLGVTEKP